MILHVFDDEQVWSPFWLEWFFERVRRYLQDKTL